VLIDNLKLLLRLYVRPRQAMSAILDEGSVIFGLAAVLLLSLFSQAPWGAILAAHLHSPALLTGLATSSGFGALSFVAGLALLYVPALVFVTTLLDRRAGSFGVALRRDYGGLATCTLMAWAAAQLPVVLVTGIVGYGTLGWLAAPLAGAVYFGVLMVFAMRTVYGLGLGTAAATVVLASLVLPFSGRLGVLASPFVLFWAYLLFRGDIGSIAWSLGSRRSFKRHLEAATINPRDAEAHYQLGLLYQQRRQHPEAIARFQKAIEIDPAEIDAHYQLGRIAREQERWADAIRHFEAVVAQDPRHARHEIWREVGATYMGAGDFANARPMLERYVENRPYDAEGLYHLGLAQKRLGEAEKARETFERCIEAARTAPDYRRRELRRWRKLAEAER
jgi:Flp pilus assembly protein TadD